jgi:hypothetical protein
MKDDTNEKDNISKVYKIMFTFHYLLTMLIIYICIIPFSNLERLDIAEILLKLALNTNQSINQTSKLTSKVKIKNKLLC